MVYHIYFLKHWVNYKNIIWGVSNFTKSIQVHYCIAFKKMNICMYTEIIYQMVSLLCLKLFIQKQCCILAFLPKIIIQYCPNHKSVVNDLRNVCSLSHSFKDIWVTILFSKHIWHSKVAGASGNWSYCSQ